MYILKLENNMIFTQKNERLEFPMEDDLEGRAILRYSGCFENREIKEFILEAVNLADGNPIQVNIPLEDKYLTAIKGIGLELSNKGYLYSPYQDIKPYELTALKLLRDGYTIEFDGHSVIIC